MTAAAFVASSSGTASATSVAVTAPAGLAGGDHQLVVLGVGTDAETLSAAPSGWTLLSNLANTTDTFRTALYYSDSDTGTATFGKSGSAQGYAVRLAWRGGPGWATGSVVANAGTSSTSTPSLQNVTTTSPDSLVIGVCHAETGAANVATHTPPAGWTERFDDTASNGTRRQAVAVFEITKATVGTQTGGTVTVSRSDFVNVFGIALNGAGEVTVDDPTPATVEVGSPGGETVEALDNTLTVVDAPSAQAAVGSPGGEAVAVVLPADAASAQAVSGASGGEAVAVATTADAGAGAGAVGSPGGEVVDVAEPGLPAGGQPYVTLWVVDRDTGGLIPMPHALKVDLSPQRNAPGAFSFDYPAFGRNFEVLRTELEDNRRRVEVEFWVGGSRFNAMRGDVLQVAGDDVAEGSVWSFHGHFLEWRMTDARLAHDPADEKGEVHFSAATPGVIMRTLMQQAQAHGTLTDISYADFTNSLDSAGEAWAKTVTIKFTPYKSSYLTVLDRLVALGLCEWEITVDHELRVFNPGGRGRDLTTRQPPTRLKIASSILESQRRIDLRDVGTDLFGTGAEGLFASAVDASARARIGAQIERDVDSNNTADAGALTAFVQNTLPTVTEPVVELTHGLLFGSTRPAPVSGFRIGDWLYSDVGRGLERVRVVQWVLSQNVEGVTGSVTLNDTIGDRVSRLQKQLAALGDGSATVGTSTPSPTEDTLAPAAPTGVVADSLAYQDGAVTYASVLVGWTPVTTNSDATAADDVSGYRVEWRAAASGSDGWQVGKVQPGGSSASTSFGGVDAGINIRVRVAAYDYNGNTSEWSAEVALLTETDNTAPPVPSAPVVTPYLGQLKIAWNGLGSAGETMPPDLAFVEVHLSTASGFTPSAATLIDHFSTIAGERHAIDLNYGVTYYVRLISVDRTTPVANRSAPSAQGSAAPEKVVQIDIGPNAIGQAQIIDLEVITAKIDNLAVNDAKFGSGSFGKLTAGTISVAVTNAGIIRSGTSGQRYELDAAALRFYDTGDTQTVGLNGSSNFISGVLSSALSGTRWEMQSDGTLRHYSSGFSGYSQLSSLNGDLIMRGRMDGSGRSGRVNTNIVGVGINFSNDAELGNLRSEVIALDRFVGVQAPVVLLRANGRYSPASGARRIGLIHTDSSGNDLLGSVLHYITPGGDGGTGTFVAPQNNSGVSFALDRLLAVTGDGLNFQIMKAQSYEQISSRAVKEDIVDARTVFDPIAAVRASRAWSYRYSAEKFRTPPPTEDDPNPAPVPVEAPTRIGVLAEELPGVLVAQSTDGRGGTVASVDLGSWIGMLHGAVWQILNREEHVAVGRVTVSSSEPREPWSAGTTHEVTVAWDAPPLAVPDSGAVIVYAAAPWLGRTTAKIVPGSVTAAGCTITVTVLATVAPSTAQPITYEVQAPYDYFPPYNPEA